MGWVATIALLSTVLCGVAVAQDAGIAPDPELDPAPETEELVVTGTRTPTQLADAPVATEVTSRDDIEQAGAESLGELMESQGGVQVSRSFRGAGLSLQGLDPKHTLILIDGERAVGATEGTLDLERFSAEHIERIEIVKGAGSALYGADAIGGVVNIITRRPKRGTQAELHGAYGVGAAGRESIGDRQLIDASAMIGGRGETLRGRLSAGWHQADGFDLEPADVATSGSDSRTISVTQRSAWRPVSALELHTAAEYSERRQVGIDVAPTGAVFDRTDLAETLSLEAGPELRLDGGTRLKATGRYTRYRDQFLSDQRGADALDSLEDVRIDFAHANAQVDHTLWDWHRLSVGVDAFHERAQSRRIEGDGTRIRGALYLQDQWTLSGADPYLVVVPGVRVDHDSEFGDEPTGQLAARYDPVESLALRGSAGLAFRAPDFKERLLRFENPSVGYVVRGTPDLQPETARSFQLSGAYTGQGRWQGRLGLWRTDVNGLIQIERVDQALMPGVLAPYAYTNVDRAYTQGLETWARYQPAAWVSASATYTLTDARDKGRDRALEGRALHQVQVDLRGRHAPSGLSLSIKGLLVGPRPFYEGIGVAAPSADPDRVEARFSDTYLDLDARLAWTPEAHLTVYLRGQNLLDAGEHELLPLTPRTISLGATGRL